jgi:nitroreductase
MLDGDWSSDVCSSDLAALGIVVIADPAVCDVWIEDCSIASTYIQLAAESLGLSSCWIQVRLREHREGVTAAQRIRELLNIPETKDVLSIIALGYPAQTLEGHPKDSLLYPKIHQDVYRQG